MPWEPRAMAALALVALLSLDTYPCLGGLVQGKLYCFVCLLPVFSHLIGGPQRLNCPLQALSSLFRLEPEHPCGRFSVYGVGEEKLQHSQRKRSKSYVARRLLHGLSLREVSVLLVHCYVVILIPSSRRQL